MADKRLSPVAQFVELGYGQVEPNHLSAQATKEIYAQLPLDSSIEVLENGMFAKYDFANGAVNFSGEGDWMLAYTPVKIYDEDEQECDFAVKNNKYAASAVVVPASTAVCPRLMATKIGDWFTTNTIKDAEVSMGAKLHIGADGYLTTGEGAQTWQVVKVYTMPDGQKGVKIMRIA